jgi:quercetin dioxygenase-like cupin family protein
VPTLSASVPDTVDQAVVEGLGECMAPAMISAGQRSRIRQHIRNQIATHRPPAGTHTWRSAGNGWVDGLPGIRLRFLRVDEAAGTQEVLVRFLPGGAVPAHSHAKEEQMVIIDGTVFVGEHRLGPGDVHVAEAGTTHAGLASPEGALLLLRCEHPFPVDR